MLPISLPCGHIKSGCKKLTFFAYIADLLELALDLALITPSPVPVLIIAGVLSITLGKSLFDHITYMGRLSQAVDKGNQGKLQGVSTKFAISLSRSCYAYCCYLFIETRPSPRRSRWCDCCFIPAIFEITLSLYFKRSLNYFGASVVIV